MDISYAFYVTAVIETSTFEVFYEKFSSVTETSEFFVSSVTFSSVTETYTCEYSLVMTSTLYVYSHIETSCIFN